MTRIPETSKEAIDQALSELDQNREAWAKRSVADRIADIDQMMIDFAACAEDWVEAAVSAKSLGQYPGGPGQEYLAGTTPTLRNLRLLRNTLVQIRDSGAPKIAGPVRDEGDRAVAQVFPGDVWDKLLFAGFTGEVWMQPGVTKANLNDNMAAAYRNPKDRVEISLVLGAGNVASIAPMDCFYKFFVENKIVLLKMHPVNQYLGPFLSRGMKTLIDQGFLRIIYGDAEVGDYSCKHALVDDIHITGSDKTHDIIVFGPPADVAKNKEAKTPSNPKPITSELGNVSPFIIVPGQWSDSELAYQAENVFSSLTNNAGFNCNATRVIVTQKGWPQRDAFLAALRNKMKDLPSRAAYYPGAFDRCDSFLSKHPDAEQFGERSDTNLPWVLITDVPANEENDICFGTEAFCGLFSETQLEADSPEDFLKKAVDFSNDKLWGTLSISLMIDPRTRKRPGMEAVFKQAIADLKYGSIGVNHWAALSYAFCSTTWGAFPGHSLYDVQSGRDVVHNTLMFDKPEKSVVYGPWILRPKPAWFVTHKTGNKLGRAMTQFEAKPSLLKLPSILINAIGG